jgi:hypothetical protein
MLPVHRATRATLPAIAALCLLLLPRCAWAKHKTEPAPPQPHATLPPLCDIPVDALGFAPPGDIYLGSHNTLVSLDFLDEDRLLFTFRVPGLLRRDPSGATDETQRYIRALVLHIPDGHVLAETLWTLHDRARYLYPLDNGQFLLRDRNTLSLGDGSLQPTPWLQFPGPLLWVEMDPTRKFLVTGSRESAAAKPKADDAPPPATAQASTQASTSTANLGVKQQDYVLRILERPSAQVLLLTHVHNAVHLPLSTEGYLDTLRSTHDDEWIVNLDYITGGSTRVGAVDSTCVPTLDFLSPQEYLSRVCDESGARIIEAFTLDGKRLWSAKGRDTNVWPVLTTNQNGTRLAMEVLHANHSINASATTFTQEDITSQEVDVFDAANGHIALRAQASPIFDAGGNVALSPSGRRAAILMQEGIEVFNLPDPPAIPAKQP